MGTFLQKNLAKNIVKNTKRKKPLNKTELVVSSGYTEMSAKSSAHLILEQEGVKKELNKLGFDESNAKRVVGNILDDEGAKDRDRLTAADMVFEVFGSKAPEKTINLNVNANVADKELENIRQEYEKKLQSKLLDENPK